MKIKICGLKYPDNIQAIEALGPQYMGFIFYGRSPRFAGDLDAGASAAISPDIIKTGVFVNESAEQIKALIDKYVLVQCSYMAVNRLSLLRDLKAKYKY